MTEAETHHECTQFVEPVDRLIQELVRTVNHLPPITWRRVRFAVTEEEWELLRQYCLTRDGTWYGRIRDVPLVVERDPKNPMLFIEAAGLCPIEPPTGCR